MVMCAEHSAQCPIHTVSAQSILLAIVILTTEFIIRTWLLYFLMVFRN